MGNCVRCFNGPREAPELEEPQVSGSAPTVERVKESSAPTVERVKEPSAPTLGEVIDSLKGVSDTIDLHEFVHIIKQLLKDVKLGKEITTESAMGNKGMWASSVASGAKFLKFVDDNTQKEDKKDILSSGNSRVVAEILGHIGQLHWAVGGLAVTAYVIQKLEKVTANKVEALNLLSNMVDLATTLIQLRDVIEEERLKKTVMLVLQASIMCISQIHSCKIFRFLKTSVNSENLREMSHALDHIYLDLTLAISAKNAMCLKRLLEIASRLSILVTLPKPLYWKGAEKYIVLLGCFGVALGSWPLALLWFSPETVAFQLLHINILFLLIGLVWLFTSCSTIKPLHSNFQRRPAKSMSFLSKVMEHEFSLEFF